MTGREQYQGKQLVVRDGQEIGSIERVFVNDTTGEPDWATVRMGVLRREHVVPLAGAQISGDSVRIPHMESAVKNAPKLEFDDHLSADDITTLSRHYGTGTAARGTMNEGVRPMADTGTESGTGMRSDSAAMQAGREDAMRGGREDAMRRDEAMRSGRDDMRAGTEGQARAAGTGMGTGTAAGAAGSRAQQTGAAGGRHAADDIRVPEDLHREATLDVVRYGERLHVAKENREAGRVKLRKYVEQTPMEQRVELQHETYEVVTLPVDEQASAGTKSVDWTDEIQELVLFDEQAHVTKEIVPLERVVVRKKLVREEKVVRESVRTEQFEIIEPNGAHGKAGAMTGERRASGAEHHRR